MNDIKRVIEKPWGKEEVVEINDRYMVKKLTMWQGHRCSLQYHEIKQETIYVLAGKLRIYTGESQESLVSTVYEAGDFITLAPGVIHRMEGETDAVYLEASTPEMEDVVRLVDDYERAPK